MDDLGSIIWILILGVIGLFSLIRKAIEKATSGEEGKKIDLGEAVQTKIRKYMDAMEGRAPVSGPPGIVRTPPVRPAPPPTPPRPPAPRPAAPAATPAALVQRVRPAARRAELKRRPVSAGTRSRLGTVKAATVLRTLSRRRIDARDARRAIILAEILGPPVAERKGDRLV